MTDSGLPLNERDPAERLARRWGWAVIVLAVLLVYWPLSTFYYGLAPGDALDCWMPWRWVIASALQDGHFPLWNPYQQMGYPIYADLQGPAWYPEAIALGGTVGHSAYTLQALFLGYVIIGGIGVMRLIRGLNRDARIAVLMGTAYALGGFFTAHEMHFYSVISAAWLPWLLAAQLRLLERPSWRLAAEAALFQFLLLTGGNHTFTLIGSYLLAALIAVHVLRGWRRGDRGYVPKLLGWETLFASLVLVMACGTLYAWWEVSPFIARSSGMSYAEAAVDPFTWHAALSYLFPYAVGTDPAWLGTDAAMANGFMGVVVLLLVVLSVFRRRSAVENVFGVFGVLCVLISFGAALTAHKWFWSVVPGLDLFRFPSYYQWFTALAGLVLAAGTLAQWDELRANHPRIVRTVIGAAIVLVVAAIVRAWAMHYAEPPFSQGDILVEHMMGMGRMHRVLLNAPVTLMALIGFYFWAVSEHRRWWMLAVILVMEMGWSTMLAEWNTAIGDYSPADLQGRIDRQPVGPVWPELTPMGNNTDEGATLKYIWKNVQDFQGMPTHDGLNSFWLKDANKLEVGNPGLFAAMKRQPLVYLSDSLVAAEEYHAEVVDPAVDNALVVFPPGTSIPSGLKHLQSDSVEVVGFDDDGITVSTRTAFPTFLMLQQSWYPGWMSTMDGKPMELHQANFAAFGILLPAGTHEVAFRFEKPIVPWLLGLSLVVFFATCLLLAFTRRASISTGILLLFLMILFFAVRWSLFAHRSKAERVPQHVKALLCRIDAMGKGRLPFVVNTSRFPAFKALFAGRTAEAVRAERAMRLEDVLQATTQHPGPIWWVDAGLPTAPEVRAALLDRYHLDTLLTEDGMSAVLLLPDSSGLKARTLYAAPLGAVALDPGHPWTVAYRIPAKELLAHGPGALVIDVDRGPAAGLDPLLVIEGRRGERIIDYETFPLHRDDTSMYMQHAYVVRNLRELRHADEEVGIYVWHRSEDTLIVKDIRVRAFQRNLEHW